VVQRIQVNIIPGPADQTEQSRRLRLGYSVIVRVRIC
jgi:hypothetical protein